MKLVKIIITNRLVINEENPFRCVPDVRLDWEFIMSRGCERIQNREEGVSQNVAWIREIVKKDKSQNLRVLREVMYMMFGSNEEKMSTIIRI